MPVGPYPTFDACVVAQRKRGRASDSARKICGALERDTKAANKKLSSKPDLRTFITEIKLSEGKFDQDKEFEFISTAKQTDPRYGIFSYNEAELRQMVNNFNKNVVGTKIPIDLNHDDDHIALAWLATLRVGPSRVLKGEHSLFGKLKDFTPKGLELVETGAVRYFSIQIEHLFEKMVGKVKKTFKNVIRAIALTNMPVIKDLSPTYSENHLLINPNTMDLAQFLLAADAVLLGEKVSAEQVAHLKTLAEDVPAEGQEEAGKKVEEAEKKADEPEEEEKEEEEEEEEEEEDAEKALSEKYKDKKSFKLTEVMEIASAISEKAVKKALAPVAKSLTEARSESRERVLADNFKKMQLSEDNKGVIIKPAVVDKVQAFVRKLSDDMMKEYFSVHKNFVTTVDLSEDGHNDVPEKVGVLKPEAANKKLTEIAKKKYNENKVKDSDYTEIMALNEAKDENPKLAESASQGVQH